MRPASAGPDSVAVRVALGGLLADIVQPASAETLQRLGGSDYIPEACFFVHFLSFCPCLLAQGVILARVGPLSAGARAPVYALWLKIVRLMASNVDHPTVGRERPLGGQTRNLNARTGGHGIPPRSGRVPVHGQKKPAAEDTSGYRMMGQYRRG